MDWYEAAEEIISEPFVGLIRPWCRRTIKTLKAGLRYAESPQAMQNSGRSFPIKIAAVHYRLLWPMINVSLGQLCKGVPTPAESKLFGAEFRFRFNPKAFIADERARRQTGKGEMVVLYATLMMLTCTGDLTIAVQSLNLNLSKDILQRIDRTYGKYLASIGDYVYTRERIRFVRRTGGKLTARICALAGSTGFPWNVKICDESGYHTWRSIGCETMPAAVNDLCALIFIGTTVYNSAVDRLIKASKSEVVISRNVTSPVCLRCNAAEKRRTYLMDNLKRLREEDKLLLEQEQRLKRQNLGGAQGRGSGSKKRKAAGGKDVQQSQSGSMAELLEDRKRRKTVHGQEHSASMEVIEKNLEWRRQAVHGGKASAVKLERDHKAGNLEKDIAKKRYAKRTDPEFNASLNVYDEGRRTQKRHMAQIGEMYDHRRAQLRDSNKPISPYDYNALLTQEVLSAPPVANMLRRCPHERPHIVYHQNLQREREVSSMIPPEYRGTEVDQSSAELKLFSQAELDNIMAVNDSMVKRMFARGINLVVGMDLSYGGECRTGISIYSIEMDNILVLTSHEVKTSVHDLAYKDLQAVMQRDLLILKDLFGEGTITSVTIDPECNLPNVTEATALGFEAVARRVFPDLDYGEKVRCRRRQLKSAKNAAMSSGDDTNEAVRYGHRQTRQSIENGTYDCKLAMMRSRFFLWNGNSSANQLLSQLANIENMPDGSISGKVNGMNDDIYMSLAGSIGSRSLGERTVFHNTLSNV